LLKEAKMVKATAQSSRKSVPAAILDGKVRKAAQQQPEEQVEIQLYLSKLKDLVPNMPRNRKVSKVEVIEHVIDYICDLQMALENHPASRHGAAAIVSAMLNNNNTLTAADCNLNNNSASNSPRQPLCVISATPNATTCAQEVHPSHEHKSTSTDCGSRTVSC
jgi:Helix-loop-helix DNA-binding domain